MEVLDLDLANYTPVIFNGLYDEPKCWIDRVHILIHQFLNDCGFTGVIQTTEMASAKLIQYQCRTTDSINILISLSFNRALRNIESIVRYF